MLWMTIDASNDVRTPANRASSSVFFREAQNDRD